MSETKFASGAFVFTRAKGLQPRKPEDMIPLAEKHGFQAGIVPSYAGDRAAVGRAIQHTSSGLCRNGFLLRPIRRTSKEVVYGIVREKKDEVVDKLDHDHEATVTWRADIDPAVIEGDHTIANRVRLSYADLRGKLVAEDWSSTITKELDRLGALPFREDGRIYYAPPQSLDNLRRLGAFLEEVGVNLILAEIESESTPVVKEVVHESVEDQLHKLALEVEEFDASQKPSMFAKRLEEYQRLREKALLYKSALGIGTERTEQVLAELETKVSAMLDIRQNSTVHRDGTITRKDEKKPDKKGVEEEQTPVEQSVGTTLIFAGAKFVQAESDSAGELLFTSSDEKAKLAVAGLESMGLAGRFQKTGNVEVSIQNSGPVGAETSIKLRLPENTNLASAGKSLQALGISLAS